MHFTYQEVEAGRDLQQGDLLRRTDELCALIREVHPYYLKQDYTFFLILTQSCDLVRRDNPSATTPYITIAVVRPLALALDREAIKYRNGAILRAANANSTKSKEKVRQALERILNNNHHEYFYLHEEPAISFTDRSCAFLRLAIALRTAEGYDVCQRARIVSLAPSFETKLGWLTGNIYSRVGSEDWAPNQRTKQQFSELVEEILNDSTFWLDDDQVNAAKKRYKTSGELAALDPEHVRAMVKAILVPKKKEEVIDAVLEELSKGFIDPGEIDRARTRLRNLPALAALIRG